MVAVVTQKLTDTLNDESVADNKVMIHLLKGVIKSLKKLQSFSQEKGVSDASQRATDHLRVLYQVEDEVEKFTFRFAQQRKKFGFLMKKTYFFNNLNSCRRLKRKIKKIQTQIPASPRDVSVRTNSSLSQQNSLTTVSDDIEHHNDDEDGDDDFGYKTHILQQKSSSHVWVISEIPSSPSPRSGFLTRSFTMIPHPEKIQILSSFSNQEEELGIFGLNDDIKSLVKWVTQERNVSRFIDGIDIPVKKQTRNNEIFVPIVGELGSGKTTLARAVYRNRKIKDHFEFHDWVSVTEEYTAERILHSVSKKVGSVNENGNQNQSLLDYLKGKKYLIVIDGVGSRGVVKDLIHAFPDENNGSKVIFTSRDVWINREMNINPHIMQPLNENERWSLFLNKAGKEKEADQNQIHPMTRDRILNIRGSLPLNIVLIAKLLSTMSIERWSSVIVLNQYSDDDVLSLCYNDLRIQKKLCLLYLSLFPKDYDIPVRRLLRLWLAEGFVKKRFVKKSSEEIPPEDLVQEYFDSLVDRGMIEITKLRSDNSPRHCRLVSVFHDYLLPKAQDISLFYIHRNLENLEDAANPFGVRRMVHHMTTTGAIAPTTRMAHTEEEDTDATLSSSPSSLSCFFPSCRENIDVSDLQQSQPHSSTFDPSLLRSYVSFNFQRKDMPEKEVGILLGRIINSRFGLLRVLDLEGVCKPNLPEKLGQLCHLRYLGLRWTFLESLPESVGDLTYLETLDVKHTCVDTLPDSIWKLKHLRHLNLNNIRLAMPPSSSSSLLTLWGLVLDEKISVNEGLGKLLDLKELGIKFNLSKSQGVLLEWIAKLKNLQSLRLISVNDMGRPSKLDLKPLRDLEKLSHLNLYGNLERLPAPIEFPPTVRVLTLSVSRLDNDPMETLEQLPSLMVLRLLGDSYTGKRMVCHGGGFKKLEVLKLWKLNDLEELDVEEEAMERLKELDIRRCHNLNDISCRLLQKQRCLEELILTDMPDDFVERIKKRKSKDTSMIINAWKLAP